MKKITCLIVLVLAAGVALCQNKITGTSDLPAFQVRSFDKISFEVSYQVVDDRGTIRINVSNPRVFVHPDSKYRYKGKWYTRQDLGLLNWPQTQQAIQFGIMLRADYPGGTVNHMFSCASGTCRDNNDYIVRSVENAGKFNPSHFRVSYGGNFTYAGQGSDEVERMIDAKFAPGANASAGDNQSTALGSRNPLAQSSSSRDENGNPLPAPSANSGYTNPPVTRPSSDKLDRQMETVKQVTGLAVGLVNLFGANKPRQDEAALMDEEEAREAARVQAENDAATAAEAERVQQEANRAAELEAIRRVRDALISSRRSVFSPFGNGSIPRTLATNVSEVFFFFSSYDPGSLASEKFDLYVSNVFAVKPYGDGTWPFTDQLLSDLAKISAGRKIELAGEFASAENAEAKLADLKQRAASNGVNVREVKFEGKNTGNGQADFWGTPVTTTPEKATVATPAKEKPQSDEEFWGAPVKTTPALGSPTAKPKPAPAKTTPAPKADAIPKKAEADYWGNPVKN